MTTIPNPPDWRGLCEELIALVERCPVTSDTDWIADRNDLIVRFHAAKRNGLPQPELEVVGPTLEQVSDWITKCSQNPEENKWTRRVDHHDALAIAKAALHDWGRPAPVQPAEGEVGDLVADELVRQLRTKAATEKANRCHYSAILLTRAADLLAQRHPAPVPVSERLPGPEDCDEQGRCWWLCPPDFMELRSHATAESAFVAGATHWRPANSLPLPAGEAQP